VPAAWSTPVSVIYPARMQPPRGPIVGRQVDRFLADPASVRNAVVVIVTVTVVAVLLGSVVIWLFDRRDFPDIGTAIWFMLQTVTTVGYGDVTPVSLLGRSVAGVVMIVSIGFVTIVTALITSTFVEAAQRQRRADEAAAQRERTERVHARLDEIVDRLAAIEASFERLGARSSGATSAPSTDPPDRG
jgi:voltage-gated potassium channel